MHSFPRILFVTCFLSLPLARAVDSSAPRVTDATAPYKDAALPVKQRVKDLLGRMTLEEKVRQLDMYRGTLPLFNPTENEDKNRPKPDAQFDPARAEKEMGNLGIGSMHDLYPFPRLYNQIQSWIIASNRLGIPALFIEEGLHGFMTYNQTVFPQSVNLASTWNPELARKTGAAIAAEARAVGVNMILAPVLDIARDPRWGRTEEDFGEDPYLSGQIGLDYVLGMQGDSLATDHTVIAEPKHFAAHGSPESGTNMSTVHVGEREVRSIMLKSFEPLIREGRAGAVMAAYHDIDGLPCTANPWLLNKVLREEWGFEGFVLADLGSIRRLVEPHHLVETPAEAVCLAINSGMDMQFYDFDHALFQNALIDGVKTGKVSAATLDAAVGRVLRAKFLLGLFDRPLVDESLDAKVRRAPAHLDLSLEVARQSMCLLKNEGQLLPLRKNLSRIAVIGPNGDVARLGDYADAAKESAEYGIRTQLAKLLPKAEILFSEGEKIDEAVALAQRAEIVIMALGENSKISGEGHDRSDIGLPGNQEKLLMAVVATRKPVVLVLQNGRALTIPWAAGNVPAILEAWYPGEFGGRAIVETLLGDNNPAGRLPVSFPKTVGQLPVFYNHFPSKQEAYGDGDARPQYVFGFGLSYTTFKYDRLTVTAPDAGSSKDVAVSFALTNTGQREGDEVAQVYVRQANASVATPVRALKAFTRVHLQPGETRQITLHIKQSDLEVWGAAQKWQIEPGKFTVYVGGSSSADLSAKFNL
jgi:beta-glucosidase